ncbi:MAG: hypothetical protein ACREK9_09305 [Candidatus Rokuibacteriota bacterium]
MSGPGELFTRDEALGGLPARRAATLLFLIESRTAHLADQSRRAGDFLASEEASRERDLAFFEAFSAGREPPVAPTIRDLEWHAARWAPLVPPNPGLRAALAHLLGRKYAFTRSAVPGIREALGLDGDAVGRAYRRQYGVELETLYAAQLRVVDWLPWAWAALSARVDALSPFWLTFGLTVAFSFSQAFLALPTGVARVGAGPGVILVLVIGFVNVLTMACMAEACARSGDFRYGRAFVGRLVVNYLGTEASAFFSATTAVRTFLVMLAGTIGVGLTLATFTGIRAEAWMAVLVLAELYYLSRKSAAATITTMFSLVGLNLLCLGIIAALTLGRVEAANLLYMRVPFVAGEPLEPALLRLVVGVVMMLYIGHVYVVQCARIVLPRDPSARALIQGSVAGTMVLTAIFAVWVLAVNGVVDPGQLAGEAGTALAPLAARIGPVVHVLGSVLVLLLLGMSCLRTSTVLFNLVQERLPTRLRSVVTLPRRHGSLLFQPRGTARAGPHLSVNYLGLAEGQAHLRVTAAWDGAVERADIVVAQAWNAAALLEQFGGRRAPGVSLILEVREARAEAASLRITTTMSVSFGGEWVGAGVHLGDLTGLDDARRTLIAWMTRRGEVSLEEVVAHRGGDAAGARTLLDDLVAQGVVQPLDTPADRYRIRLAARHARRVPGGIWQALEVPAAREGRPGHPGRLALAARSVIASERGRFFLAASPVLFVFALAEWLLLAGTASFAGVLGFGGVVANSLTAGIFPVLLLAASRRKGDYVPGVVYRFLGHPVFTIGICGLSLVNLFVHGLVIYRDPWSRLTALGFALAVIGLAAMMLRRRAFGRRSVVELREDLRESAASVLTVTSAGQPLIAEVRLGQPAGEERFEAATVAVPALSKLQYVVARLPACGARELKVWAHQVMIDGSSEALPVLVDVQCGTETRRFDLKLSNGQAVLPLGADGCSVRIVLPGAEGRLGA